MQAWIKLNNEPELSLTELSSNLFVLICKTKFLYKVHRNVLFIVYHCVLFINIVIIHVYCITFVILLFQ